MSTQMHDGLQVRQMLARGDRSPYALRRLGFERRRDRGGCDGYEALWHRVMTATAVRPPAPRRGDVYKNMPGDTEVRIRRPDGFTETVPLEQLRHT